VSITPAECKGARALLGWSRTRLAARADDVSESTIRTFEDGHRPTDRKINAIRCALEAAGVEFTNGVKLKEGALESGRLHESASRVS
jgi:hypothetical protein